MGEEFSFLSLSYALTPATPKGRGSYLQFLTHGLTQFQLSPQAPFADNVRLQRLR